MLQSVGGRCAAEVAKRCNDASASEACSSVLLALLRFELLAGFECARNKIGQCCGSLWRALGARRWDRLGVDCGELGGARVFACAGPALEGEA